MCKTPTGTGVPVGLTIMQCTNAGQVLSRGGNVPTTGGCVASANQAVLMKAIPILDSENQELQLRKVDGQDYVKVWDPSLGAETWQVWTPPSDATTTDLGQPSLADKINSFFGSTVGKVVSTGNQDATNQGTLNTGGETGQDSTLFQQNAFGKIFAPFTGTQQVGLNEESTPGPGEKGLPLLPKLGGLTSSAPSQQEENSVQIESASSISTSSTVSMAPHTVTLSLAAAAIALIVALLLM